MKASEAVELMNKARESAKMERRPLVEEIMPVVYKKINDIANQGGDRFHCFANDIELNLIEDVVNQLLDNGYKVEWSNKYQDRITKEDMFIIKW